jgi:hypothetical protein
MSMIGNYLMVDESVIGDIQTGRRLIDELLYESEIEEDNFLYIDKSWHAIHFLLCRDTWGGEKPLFNVVLGGTEINQEDVGYGPARFLFVSEVKDTYKAIENISEDDMKEKFDWKELNKSEIYPTYRSNEDFEYVWGYFEELREFFKRASDTGKAMLLYIN